MPIQVYRVPPPFRPFALKAKANITPAIIAAGDTYNVGIYRTRQIPQATLTTTAGAIHVQVQG